MEALNEMLDNRRFIHQGRDYRIINNHVIDDSNRCAILVSKNSNKYLWSTSKFAHENSLVNDLLYYPPLVIAILFRYRLMEATAFRITELATQICKPIMDLIDSVEYELPLLLSLSDLKIVWIEENDIFQVIRGIEEAEEVIHFYPKNWSFNDEYGVYRIYFDEFGERFVQQFIIYQWQQNVL